jgi:hypothetical protein
VQSYTRPSPLIIVIRLLTINLRVLWRSLCLTSIKVINGMLFSILVFSRIETYFHSFPLLQHLLQNDILWGYGKREVLIMARPAHNCVKSYHRYKKSPHCDQFTLNDSLRKDSRSVAVRISKLGSVNLEGTKPNIFAHALIEPSIHVRKRQNESTYVCYNHLISEHKKPSANN